MFQLNGLNALVTGATGGLGGQIARALHAQGATVGLSGTRAAVLQALAVRRGCLVAPRWSARVGESAVTGRPLPANLTR